MTKRVFAALLALIMLFSALPMSVFAEDIAEPVAQAVEAPAEQDDNGVDPLKLDTGHKIDVTFTILYVGDEFRIGYNYGTSEKTQFVCQYSQPHSDTAYTNHTILISDIKAAADRASVNSGYQIVGWSKESNANPTTWPLDKSGTTACNKGTTIYLVAKNPNPTKYTYQLTYALNDGSDGVMTKETVNGVTNTTCTFTVTTQEPTRNGYNFLGWADGANATTAQYHASDKITLTKDAPEKTIHAVWEKIEHEHDWKYVDNKDGTHTGKCTGCDETTDVNEAHVDKDGDGKCDKCGAEMPTTPPTDVPDPGAGEFDNLKIQIKCDTKTDGSHDMQLSYSDGTYKFVRRTDLQYGFVVFTASTYLDTYNKTHPGHELKFPNGAVTWEFEYKDGKWQRRVTEKLPTITVVEKAEPTTVNVYVGLVDSTGVPLSAAQFKGSDFGTDIVDNRYHVGSLTTTQTLKDAEAGTEGLEDSDPVKTFVFQQMAKGDDSWAPAAGVDKAFTWARQILFTKLEKQTDGTYDLYGQIIAYKLTLDTAGGTLTETNPEGYYLSGTSVDLPTAEKSGYNFLRWEEQGTSGGGGELIVMSIAQNIEVSYDVTYKAIYEEIPVPEKPTENDLAGHFNLICTADGKHTVHPGWNNGTYTIGDVEKDGDGYFVIATVNVQSYLVFHNEIKPAAWGEKEHRVCKGYETIAVRFNYENGKWVQTRTLDPETGKYDDPFGYITCAMATLHYDKNTEDAVTGMPVDDVQPADANGNGSFTVSTAIPVRAGYTFLGWSLTTEKPTSPTAIWFPAGESGHGLAAPDGTILYAIWQSNVPAKPNLNEYNCVQVTCKSNDKHAGVYYAVKADEYDPATEKLELVEGVWTYTVEIIRSKFVERYSEKRGTHTDTDPNAKTTVTLTWNEKAETWISTQKARIEVTCVPEKPTADEVKAALGNVTVSCVNPAAAAGSNCTDCVWPVKIGTIGKPVKVTDTQYTVDIEISAFVSAYTKRAKVEHHLASKDTLTWVLNYENGAWAGTPKEADVDDRIFVTHEPKTVAEINVIAKGTGIDATCETTGRNAKYGLNTAFVYYDTDVTTTYDEAEKAYVSVIKTDKYVEAIKKDCDKLTKDTRDHALTSGNPTVTWKFSVASVTVENGKIKATWKAEPATEADGKITVKCNPAVDVNVYITPASSDGEDSLMVNDVVLNDKTLARIGLKAYETDEDGETIDRILVGKYASKIAALLTEDIFGEDEITAEVKKELEDGFQKDAALPEAFTTNSILNRTTWRWLSVENGEKFLSGNLPLYSVRFVTEDEKNVETMPTAAYAYLGSIPVYDYYLKNETVAAPTDEPTREGYKFLGWYEDGATEAYDFSTPVTKDVVLTAKWEPIAKPVYVYFEAVNTLGYRIALNDNALSDRNLQYNSAYRDFFTYGRLMTASTDLETLKGELKTEKFERHDDNKNFAQDDQIQWTSLGIADDGWHYGYTDKAAAYHLNGQLTFYSVRFLTEAADKVSGMPTVRYTYTIKNTKEEIKVYDYYLNGETAAAPDAEPTREGYKFLGWYEDGATEAYDFSTPMTRDVVLTAKWAKLETVNVVIYRNGDTTTAYKTVSLEKQPHGSAFDLSTLKIGDYYTNGTGKYDFYGWYNDGKWNAYKKNPENAPAGLTEIKINGWTNIICMVYDYENVVYFLDEDSYKAYQADHSKTDGLLFSTTARKGSALPTADAPAATRTGYNFLFWSREGQAGVDVTGQTVNGWTNLFGNWEKKSYIIASDLRINGNETNKADGKTYAWTHRYGGKFEETIDYQPMFDALKARTLAVDAANGPVDAEIKLCFPGSDKDFPTAVTYYGETTANWQPANNNTAYIWGYATTIYEVTFNTDGGSEVAAKRVAYNKSLGETYPIGNDFATSKPGYTFAGWLDADGNLFDLGTPITKSMTLKAKWEEAAPVTITTPVYVFFEPVNASGTKITLNDATLDRLNLTYNSDAKDWFTYGKMDAKTKLDLFTDSYGKDSSELAAVAAEINTPAFERFNGNDKFNVDGYANFTWTALKKVDWEHYGYGVKDNSFHLDGQLKFFDVTFVANAPTDEEGNALTVTNMPASGLYYDGESLAFINAPSCEGYRFVGWTFSDENFTGAVKSDLTITAKWEKLNPMNPNMPVYAYFKPVDKDGKDIKLDAATLGRIGLTYNSGKKFFTYGKFETPATIQGASYDKDDDEFKAVLEDLKNVERFATNAGFEGGSSIEWMTLNLVNAAHKDYTTDAVEAYHLDGQLKFYTVTFEANAPEGATVENMPASGLYYDGESLAFINAPSCEGYRFVGWTFSDENFTGAVKSDLTITAKWEKLNPIETRIPVYTFFRAVNSAGENISLDEDLARLGLTYNDDANVWFTLGKLLTTQQISEASYAKNSDAFNAVVGELGTTNFTRLDTNADFEGMNSIEWQELKKVNCEHLGYGVTDEAYHLDGTLKFYSINFNANTEDAVYNMPESGMYYEGEALPNGATPTRPGWFFAGWYDDAACTIPHDFGNGMPGDTKATATEDLTVYAKWTQGSGKPVNLQVTLTIECVTRNGKLLDTEVYVFDDPFAEYSIKAPKIKGYTTKTKKVEGTMPGSNYTVTIVYRKTSSGGGATITESPNAKKTSKAPALALNVDDHFAYVAGYPDGTVKPEGNVTRAETAAILYRIMDAECRSYYETSRSSYSDVARSDWFSTYVATLENAGVIVDTRTNGKFRPNEAITRAELASMLAQFAGLDSASASKFNDVGSRYWAAEEIAIAAKMGWINGYPDGSFRPDRTVTRAELMAMVNRALGRTPKSEDDLLSNMKTWKDNADVDAWYYLDVQEATNSHTYTKSGSHESWKKLVADAGF